MRIGINIDHIATLRNARGDLSTSSLLRAIKICEKSKVEIITAHLREDRRHINDNDLIAIKKNSKIPINLEMALTKEMIDIALKIKPKYICIVPEKRKEITTEGGLKLNKKNKKLFHIIKKLNKSKIRTSLFINPNLRDIKNSKKVNVKCIELHTGKISNLIKSKMNYKKEFNKIKKCAEYGKSLGLEIHAGHGMDYKTTKVLSKIKEFEEFNIGHFLIGESIYFGLKKSINNFKKNMKK